MEANNQRELVRELPRKISNQKGFLENQQSTETFFGKSAEIRQKLTGRHKEHCLFIKSIGYQKSYESEQINIYKIILECLLVTNGLFCEDTRGCVISSLADKGCLPWEGGNRVVGGMARCGQV